MSEHTITGHFMIWLKFVVIALGFSTGIVVTVAGIIFGIYLCATDGGHNPIAGVSVILVVLSVIGGTIAYFVNRPTNGY